MSKAAPACAVAEVARAVLTMELPLSTAAPAGAVAKIFGGEGLRTLPLHEGGRLTAPSHLPGVYNR